MKSPAALLVLGAALCALGACGAEDIELAAPLFDTVERRAGAGDAASSGDGVGTTSDDGAGAMDVALADGPPPTVDGQSDHPGPTDASADVLGDATAGDANPPDASPAPDSPPGTLADGAAEAASGAEAGGGQGGEGEDGGETEDGDNRGRGGS